MGLQQINVNTGSEMTSSSEVYLWSPSHAIVGFRRVTPMGTTGFGKLGTLEGSTRTTPSESPPTQDQKASAGSTHDAAQGYILRNLLPSFLCPTTLLEPPHVPPWCCSRHRRKPHEWNAKVLAIGPVKRMPFPRPATQGILSTLGTRRALSVMCTTVNPNPQNAIDMEGG